MTSAHYISPEEGCVSVAELNALRAQMRGQVCVQGDAGYDEARTVWNAMIDRLPDVVFRCAGAADVRTAVRFAVEHDFRMSVRGGGHNIAGTAVADGGAMIDLSAMRGVRVDKRTRRMWAGPGATLGDVDRETQAFGLAVPTGINSTTGLAGLTLGGGFGWLTRPLGMTIDSLVSADVVTAGGDLVRASESENPDLFWAIRGGGGNFGVVTAFELELHAVGPQVFSGLIVHPFAEAEQLLQEYRGVVADAPDELTVWAIMRKAPPLPFIPAQWHGRDVLIFAACYAGPMEAGAQAIAPLRRLGRPIADVVGPHAFVAWQSAFDPLLAPGARNYWKTHDFTELSDAAIAAITRGASRMPGPECELFIAHVGGAMSRVPPQATAYPHRSAHFIMNAHARWRDASRDETFVAWARELFKATAPFATGGGYVNFMPADEPDRIEKVYGPNYRRLAEVKRRWDPDNRFRLNQNIRPLS